MGVSRCLFSTRSREDSVDGSCLLEGLAPSILSLRTRVVLVLCLPKYLPFDGQTRLVSRTVHVKNSSDFTMLGSRIASY